MTIKDNIDNILALRAHFTNDMYMHLEDVINRENSSLIEYCEYLKAIFEEQLEYMDEKEDLLEYLLDDNIVIRELAQKRLKELESV